MDEKQIPKKPLCLEYQEAREEMFAAINSVMGRHEIPLFLFAQILAEAHGQTEAAAQAEALAAKKNYQAQIESARKDDTK